MKNQKNSNSNNLKHVPMRTCIITRKRLPKSELIRLVVDDSLRVRVDLKGKIKGRGANISPDMEIFERALSRGAVEKALKLKRKFSSAEKAELQNQFLSALEEREFRPQNKPVSIRVEKKDLDKVVKN